jgi:[acyl-carrier-protein] S-malonyltransferase
MPALAARAGDPPARARVIPLSVAGAFHTEYMRPAVHELAAHAAGLSPSDPRMTLLSNADGAAVGTGAEVLERLVAQVSNPVRWDRCMATLTELGTTAMIELCPAGTLTNLAKRAMRGVPVVALRGPDDLVAARALLAEHGAAR